MCLNLVDYMLVSDDLYSCMSIKNPLNDNLSRVSTKNRKVLHFVVSKDFHTDLPSR